MRLKALGKAIQYVVSSWSTNIFEKSAKMTPVVIFILLGSRCREMSIKSLKKIRWR